MNPDNLKKIKLLDYTEGAAKRTDKERQRKEEYAHLMEFDARDEKRAFERPAVIEGLQYHMFHERSEKYEIMHQLDRSENDTHLACQVISGLEKAKTTLVNTVEAQDVRLSRMSDRLSTYKAKDKKDKKDKEDKKDKNKKDKDSAGNRMT